MRNRTRILTLVGLLAPFLAVTLSLIPVVVMPFGPELRLFGIETRWQLTDLNIGVLFVSAVGGLGGGHGGGGGRGGPP